MKIHPIIAVLILTFSASSMLKAQIPNYPALSPEMKAQMMAAGANGIITKPFPPEELQKVLSPLLKK